MYAYTWYQWLAFFYFYSFFGWVFESAYVSILQKRPVNRGFLRIPLLPLYGSGAVMMLWVSLPFRGNLVLTFLAGMAGATLLEYVTGYVMELLFKVRYWDYSGQKWNLNGYICLSSSVAWGFLTILMTHAVHKPIAKLIAKLPAALVIAAVCAVTVIFVYDMAYSIRAAFAFGQALEALAKLRADLDGLQVQKALLKMDAADLLEERLEKLRAETEAKAAAIRARHARYRARLLRANPTLSSHRFRRALEEEIGAAPEERKWQFPE